MLPALARSRWLGLLVSLGSVTAVTVLIYAFDNIMPMVATGVLYLLAVLLVSTYWGLWLGVFTSIASAFAFNFFHIPPTGRLTIAEGEHFMALAVYLVVAVVVSALANAARRRELEADRQRHELLMAAEERDRLEDQLVETKALRKSDVLKTAILRSVSHDLRSPLTGISTALGGLRSPSISEGERVELIDLIAKETERLSRLVDDLLDFSRLEAGGEESNPQWCAVEEILEAALDSLGKSLSDVKIAFDEDLPLVQVDPVQVERVLANLLDNALRYAGPDDPVTVRGRVTKELLIVRVTDQGPGIPQDEIERIFEPFYRYAPGGGGGGGSGLGLAIARGFAEANGGRLWAKSPLRQVTSFVIELPLGES